MNVIYYIKFKEKQPANREHGKDFHPYIIYRDIHLLSGKGLKTDFSEKLKKFGGGYLSRLERSDR